MRLSRRYSLRKGANRREVEQFTGWILSWLERQDITVSVMSSEQLRTLEQNSKLWPMLTDISRQCQWFNQSWEPDSWKTLLISAWRTVEKDEKPELLPGIEGEMVAMNYSTRSLSKSDFSSFIEYIYSYGAMNGVQWSEPAAKAYETYREAQQ